MLQFRLKKNPKKCIIVLRTISNIAANNRSVEIEQHYTIQQSYQYNIYRIYRNNVIQDAYIFTQVILENIIHFNSHHSPIRTFFDYDDISIYKSL